MKRALTLLFLLSLAFVVATMGPKSLFATDDKCAPSISGVSDSGCTRILCHLTSASLTGCEYRDCQTSYACRKED
jgi:hypothetical protein